MRILIVAVALMVSGCVHHMTLHEACSLYGEAERYGGYEQCLEEKREERIASAESARAFSNSMRQYEVKSSHELLYGSGMQRDSNRRQCITKTDAFGRLVTDCEDRR